MNNRIEIVAIPHQGNPTIWRVDADELTAAEAVTCTDDTAWDLTPGLELARRLDDLRAWVRRAEAATYHGHQAEAVHALA